MSTKAKAVDAGAKTPEDKKPKKHAVTDRFEFTLSTGDVVSAAYLENVPYKVFKGISSAEDDAAGQDLLFAGIMSEDDFAVWDDNVLMGELMEFLEKWQEESAITLGELGAS